MENFSAKIKSLRQASRLTLQQVCDQVGIPPSRLHEMELGVRIPTDGQIAALAHFFKIKTDDLKKTVTN